MDTDAVKSYQNFRLISDLKLKRRQLQEAQEELETLRSKSREMETMVGVVQRAWSQVICWFCCLHFYQFY